MIDLQGRNIEYVRVSITDRCNMRCLYCMPEGGVECLSHEELLTFEEIVRVVRLMTEMGVRTVRITGGEPMVRRGCLNLVDMLHGIEGIDRIAMTTNGMLLRGRMAEAKAKGLKAVNISLDTLDEDAFSRITRAGSATLVLDAVREAVDCGLQVKINAVPIRGLNERGLCEVAALAQELPVDVRFIELMPVGCGEALIPIPTDEIRQILEERFGPLLTDNANHGYGPAVYGKPQGFKGSIGFIGAISHAFCDRCNRVRITPEGILKLCLNHERGLDLRALLRSGAADRQVLEAMRDAVLHKPLRHDFTEIIDDKEHRRMNQIGG